MPGRRAEWRKGGRGEERKKKKRKEKGRRGVDEREGENERNQGT